ncbi:MAG: hypothetical protein JXA13_08720 [Anaerolineales bacterium]|nr:hypothetical protein [Anaerolineales bacterium]
MDSWPINIRRVAAIAGIMLLAFLVMDFNTRLEKLDRLNRQATLVYAHATQVMQTQAVLQTRVVVAESDLPVEDWARGEGNRAKPGDFKVVPLPEPGSEPVVTKAPTSLPTPLPHWQVWLELFFGG